jgi:hypothetical protein
VRRARDALEDGAGVGEDGGGVVGRREQARVRARGAGRARVGGNARAGGGAGGGAKMGDGGVFRTPCADFCRPVEELEYDQLLKSTFTEASHVRGFKTWKTAATYPECVFCGKMYRWGAAYVECHMDPNISKATTGKERVVAACADSQSTSRGPNRTRFLAVQAAIRAKTLQWWNTLNHKIPKVRVQRERKGRIGTHFYFQKKKFSLQKNKKIIKNK